MSINYFNLKGSLSPSNFIKLSKYRRDFRNKHPFYFKSDGLLVFIGSQGSGKTLSAVKYVKSLMEFYPKALLVSNIELKEFPFDGNKVFLFKNADDLSKYNNGEFGVIFLIDEIQLYFNSLESKNIDPQVMVQISQQRKQRKHIVGTSQVFGRLAKPLREQFANVIYCKNYFNSIQVNKLIDRDSIDGETSTDTNLNGTVKKRFIWLHSPRDYDSYDTYNIINNNFKDIKNQNIFEERSSDYNVRLSTNS